jgi:hypothetical protein
LLPVLRFLPLSVVAIALPCTAHRSSLLLVLVLVLLVLPLLLKGVEEGQRRRWHVLLLLHPHLLNMLVHKLPRCRRCRT